MTRKRLREAHDAAELARIYAEPHDHSRWPDHRIRVKMTIALAWSIDPGLVADLSCGDGAIARALACKSANAPEPILGDFAAGYAVTGAIEQTVRRIPNVDTFVLSETLEHLDDPGMVLASIRTKARHLILTTPIEAWDDGNVEHYWAWDRDGVEDLARRAGWHVEVFASLDCRSMGGYLTGMWVLS